MIQKQEATKRGIKILDSNKPCNALLENLKANFPQTIKDGQVDLKAIALLLGLSDKANIQGYELTFTGKGLANALYTTPCQKALKHKETFCYSESALAGEESQNEVSLKDESQTKNTLIIGDNLDALKLLKSAYSEKIKMIYIDPPYNTRNDDFIYPDDFRADYKAILREVGLLEIDEEGNEVESETLQFFRNITGSKSHSGWLSFMLPRLKLARDLLREDGVIFISIDDNEQANLKLLCDEIFGEENFVCCAVNENVKIRKNSAKTFSMSHDSILIYTKNIDLWNRNLLPRKDISGYKNPDNDPRGVWIPIPIHANHHYNANYTITKPNGVVLEKPKNTSWRLSEESLKQHIEQNRIWWGNGDSYPMIKRFLSEVQDGLVPRSIFYYDETGGNPAGDKGLKELFDGLKVFDNPKSIELIKMFLQISTSANSNDMILDFFAGSGTTAQAVMELNAEDKGNRECILVQLDEPIKEEKNKVAYDFCKKELGSKNPTISDITLERVKRAAKKINANMCLNVFSLESKPKLISDEKGTLALTTNTNLSALDKAINLALSAGKTLSQTLQVVLEGKLYKCEDSYFCIECDKAVLETLAKTSDEYIYLDGFADIDLEHFLNLDAQFKERLNIVY